MGTKPFWASAEIPASDELDRRCQFAAKLLEQDIYPPRKDARDAVHTLFSLARVSLPDVRANYFWPEVTRELARRTSVSLETAHVAKNFRRWIADVYPSVHEWETGHRYVGTVFEQAGIGSGRNRIIKLYLKRVVEVLEGCSADVAGNETASVALQELELWLGQADRELAPDVPPLRSVLLRMGVAVSDFATFIRNYPDRIALGMSSWDVIKQTWEEASGVDPDTLTPSARDVLHEIVSHLSRTLTRKEVLRRHLEGLLIEFPKGLRIGQSRRASEVPIGPARVSGPFGRVDVQVVEHPSISSAKLQSAPRNQWIEAEGFWYRTEDKPFSVPTQDGGDMSAAMLFSGSDIKNARLEGYCWIADFPPESGALAGARHGRRLFTEHRFAIRSNSLVLRLTWFRLPGNFSGDAALVIGGVTVWKGSIECGVPQGWVPVRQAIEAINVSAGRVSVRAEYEGLVDEVRLSTSAALDYAVLTHRGRIVRPHSELCASGSDELCLYVQGDLQPSIQNGSWTSSSEVTIAGTSFTKRVLVPDVEALEPCLVRARGRGWRIHRPTPFRTDLALAATREIDGVRIECNGSVRVTAADEAFHLLLMPNGASQSLPPRLELLADARDGEHVVLPVSSGQLAKTDDGAYRIEITSFLGNISSGMCRIGIAGWDDAPEQMFTIYRVHAALPRECRVGEQPRLALDLGAGHEVTVQARDSISLASVAEGKRAIGKIESADGQVWLSWPPVVRDWLINSRSGANIGHRLHLASLEHDQVIASFFAPSGEPWRLMACNTPQPIPEGGQLDLEKVIVALRAAQSPGSTELVLTGVSGGVIVSWTLDLQPVVSQFSHAWAHAGAALPRLHITGSVRGLFPEVLTVRVRLGTGALIESAVDFGEACGLQTREFSCYITFPRMENLVLFSGDDTFIELMWRGVSLAHAVILLEHVSGGDVSSEQLTKDLIANLREYQAKGAQAYAEAAMAIIARFCAAYGRLPLSPAQLLAPVMNTRSLQPSQTSRLFADSVRMLGGLFSNDTLAITYVPAAPGDSRFLRMIRASLVVFCQHRMSAMGLMAPAVMAAACKELELMKDADPRWSDWCDAVARFGAGLIVHDAGLDRGKDERLHGLGDLPLPLAAIYGPFRNWAGECVEECNGQEAGKG